MKFIAPLFTTLALMSTALAAPTGTLPHASSLVPLPITNSLTESNVIEVRDSQTNAIMEGLVRAKNVLG
jgi:hypothetical protein